MMEIPIILIAVASMVVIDTIDWLVNIIRNKFGLTEEEKEAAINSFISEEMNDKEREMMDKTANCINRMFGDSVIKRIKAMEAEERKEASDNLIQELCNLYGIQLDGIEYFAENSGMMGAYCRSTNSIKLNIQWLLSNDPRAIREYLDTIIHELCHAIQWHILESKVDWDISEDRQKEWCGNFMSYIPSNRSVKMYFMQPVEIDAFAFAAGAMRGVRL